MTSSDIDLRKYLALKCNVQDHIGSTMNTVILFPRMGGRFISKKARANGSSISTFTYVLPPSLSVYTDHLD